MMMRRSLGWFRYFYVPVIWLCLAPFAQAKPFDCAAHNCGIQIEAPYPNLVIGLVDGVASESMTQQVFVDAKKRGDWRVFPNDPAIFSSKLRIFSVTYAPGRSITLVADVGEVNALHLSVGDMVRFAPHRGLHEKPRPNDPYWVGIGCVVPLCRHNDTECQGYYHAGLFRLKDGVQLDQSGKNILAGGIEIDPFSLQPSLGPSGLGGNHGA